MHQARYGGFKSYSGHFHFIHTNYLNQDKKLVVVTTHISFPNQNIFNWTYQRISFPAASDFSCIVCESICSLHNFTATERVEEKGSGFLNGLLPHTSAPLCKSIYRVVNLLVKYEEQLYWQWKQGYPSATLNWRSLCIVAKCMISEACNF